MNLPAPDARDCLKCRHCYIAGGCSDYSEVTPGEPPEFTCRKGHWDLHRQDVNRLTLHHALQTAKTCPDYTEEPRS